MLAFMENANELMAMADDFVTPPMPKEYMPPAVPDDIIPALSDKTKIRNVTWGDFKEDAMQPDFEPAYWFFGITQDEHLLLNRLIAAQKAQDNMKQLDPVKGLVPTKYDEVKYDTWDIITDEDDPLNESATLDDFTDLT